MKKIIGILMLSILFIAGCGDEIEQEEENVKDIDYFIMSNHSLLNKMKVSNNSVFNLGYLSINPIFKLESIRNHITFYCEDLSYNMSLRVKMDNKTKNYTWIEACNKLMED